MPQERLIGLIALGVFLTTLLGTIGYAVFAMAPQASSAEPQTVNDGVDIHSTIWRGDLLG